MALYPESVARCHHIKVDGTQCGSPALRDERYCYYHMRWHTTRMSVLRKKREDWIAGLPTMEDANSVQVGLAEVMRLLVTKEVDLKTGALLLYAMQTGSANLKRTCFEPEPRRVVIDSECVGRRPIGATAWSRVEGREYDELIEDELTNDPLTQLENQVGDAKRQNELSVYRNQREQPENERLLPGETQRDRYIRVRKQKGLPIDREIVGPGPI